MRLRLLASTLLLLCLLTGRAQTASDTVVFRIASYNVENLFDCRHDSLHDDYEFLPQATRHWTYAKYRKKLDNLARVITALGGWTPPALVALCEVENDHVLRDLTRYSALRNNGYRYLLTQSNDLRGIDVALIYQRALFKPICQQSLRVEMPHKASRPTRDILYVSGLLLNGDTLDVLVGHFPSRRGGAKQSAPYREKAALCIKTFTDSLFRIRQRAQIIVMGDFNDYPHSPLIQKNLQAKCPPPSPALPDEKSLYHLLANQAAKSKHRGSYKYQGAWQWLDHIVVSGSLICQDAPFHTAEHRAGVFAPPFLLTEDSKYGGMQPFCTYYGMKYQGGYSDHLPVYAEFTLIY